LPVADFEDERSRYREQLVSAVREAGQLALAKFRGPLKSWNKGNYSPVSEADIAVNDLLKARLIGETSVHGWLSEESVDDDVRLDRRLTWVVDPIDGTRNYIAGREDWALSVALVADGRPVAGAVFAPARDEFFLASLGEGATLNGRPIKVAPGENMERAQLAGPRDLLDAVGLSRLGAVYVPRIGSLALRLALVSDGRLSAAFAGASSHDWDLAAADLLVHEAGGRMTTLKGDTLRYNQRQLVHDVLVAAGESRHAWLVTHLRSHRAAH
jgi:myo-inositol-1(or 4)-monophosphatase